MRSTQSTDVSSSGGTLIFQINNRTGLKERQRRIKISGNTAWAPNKILPWTACAQSENPSVDPRSIGYEFQHSRAFGFTFCHHLHMHIDNANPERAGEEADWSTRWLMGVRHPDMLCGQKPNRSDVVWQVPKMHGKRSNKGEEFDPSLGWEETNLGFVFFFGMTLGCNN